MGKLHTRETFELNTERDGSGDQYYDQVCAISQEAINRSFIKLFKHRPDVGEMIWIGAESAEGELKAELLPPSIELSLENRAECEVYYQLRIKTGRIDYGKNTHQDVSGWVISLPAKLQSTVVSVDPDVQKTEDQKELAAAQLEELEKNVDLNFKKPTELIPGEYSIHRLFAAIASRAWGSPNWDRSSMVNAKGDKVSLAKWFEEPGNNLMYSRVAGTLKNWAIENRISSLFTLGMQLKLPRGPIPQDLVTFAPKALQVQTYSYISDARQKELADKNQALTGLLGDPYNCFCYCEVADKDRKDLPGTKLLPFTGNLALPKEGKREEIAGSFVLDHRLFLEKHLLPQLQELNVGTMIIPLTPFMEVVDNVAQFNLKFCSGSNPEDAKDRENLPPIVASHPDFKFTKVGPQKYEWKRSLSAPGSKQDFVKRYGPCTQSPFYRRYVTTSDTKVAVEWKPGCEDPKLQDDQFKVSGECVFRHWESHSFNTDDWPNGGRGRYGNKDGEYYWSAFTDTARWSFIIDLHVPQSSKNDPEISNGVIEPSLIKVSRTELSTTDPKTKEVIKEEVWMPDDFEVKVNNMQYNLTGTHVMVEEAMRASIGRGLARATKNIQNNFHGIGKFVYPGSGELSFGPPTIAENGNILASIDYKAPDSGRVSWKPPPKGKVDPAKPGPSIDYTTDPSITTDQPRLNWSITISSWNPSTFRLKMTLQASNVSPDLMAFKSVKFMPWTMRDMDGKRLFNERWDKWGDRTEIEKRTADFEKSKADRYNARKVETEQRLKDRELLRQKTEIDRKLAAETLRKDRAAAAKKEIDDQIARRAAAKKSLEEAYAAEDAKSRGRRATAKAEILESRKKLAEDVLKTDAEKDEEEQKQYDTERQKMKDERLEARRTMSKGEADEDIKKEKEEDTHEKKSREAALKARLEARKKLAQDQTKTDADKDKEDDGEYELEQEKVEAERAKKAKETAAAYAAEDKNREAAAKVDAQAQEQQDKEAQARVKDDDVKRAKQEDDEYAEKLRQQDLQWQKDDDLFLEKNPIPSEIYKITQDATIRQEMIITPKFTDSEFQLNTTAKILTIEDDVGKPDKFIMPSGSKFSIELEGKVGAKNGAGLFVVQLNEIWAPAKYGQKVKGRADKFLVVELQDNGNSAVRFAETQAEAEALRGVRKTDTVPAK